jgi:hypothetical protein
MESYRTSELQRGLRTMMLFRSTFLLFVCLGVALSETPAANLLAALPAMDSSTFSYTVGSIAPSSCQPGQLFFNTTAVPSTNLFGCTSADTWTSLGGYNLQPAGANTLGGVTIPASSGLTVDTKGTLSLTFGSSAGTIAAGNDPRLVNALQPDRVSTYFNQPGPATPASGTTSCWIGVKTKNWMCKNDQGVVLNSVIASSGTANQFVKGVSTSGVISYAQPSFSNLTGTIGSSQLGGTVGGDLSGSLPNATVSRINGTSIPPSSSADEVVITTAAAKGTWTSLPSCTDSAGHHLNYDTTTHTWLCGTTAPPTSITGGSCPAGQYMTGISASGVPTCAMPDEVASIFTQSGTSVGRIGSSAAPASLQVSGPAPWIDVKAFGATGNGTTDDTVAIQNALNALPASGGTVFFPCGTYLVGEGSSNVGLTISASQFSFRLIGEAGTSWGSSNRQCARIVTASAITILTIGNGTTAQSGGFIEHLTFADISNSGTGGNAIGGIHMNCLSWFTLFDVELDWFANSGVNRGYGIFEDGGNDGNQYSNHNLIFRCRTQGVHYGLLL